MKICFVHKDIDTIVRGGVSNIYKNFIGYFSKIKEIKLFVITQRDFEYQNVNVIKVSRQQDYIKYMDTISNIISEIKPDIAECSNYKSELLVSSKKNINTKHILRLDPSCKTLMFYDEYFKYEKELYDNAFARIAVSKFAKDDNVKNYGNKRITVIYNPLTNIQKKITTKRVENIKQIYWCGKPNLMKGFDILIKLAKMNKNIIFNINLSNIIDGRLNLNIPDNCKIYKYITKEEQNHLIQDSDVTLITSRAEGFSYVFFESIINGTPVIYNNNCTVISEFIFVNAKQPIRNNEIAKIKFDSFECDLSHLSIDNIGEQNLNFYRSVV